MGVPVKLASSDQLLLIEKVHYCIKIDNFYVKHDIRRPMVKTKNSDMIKQMIRHIFLVV